VKYFPQKTGRAVHVENRYFLGGEKYRRTTRTKPDNPSSIKPSLGSRPVSVKEDSVASAVGTTTATDVGCEVDVGIATVALDSGMISGAGVEAACCSAAPVPG